MSKSREELVSKLGSREDGKFKLFNLKELQKLIEDNADETEWYCLGRKFKDNPITYCKHAYSSELPVEGCTADCGFYEKLHH